MSGLTFLFKPTLLRLFPVVDPTNISKYAKNLLTNMRDGAPPFSVMDFVWEEIINEPLKDL
jgi:hypothetical protein